MTKITSMINLTSLEHSDIKYKISHFPDGQQDIVIDTLSIKNGNHVCILSRFNSFSDLELIICATKALKRLKIPKISLYIPYLLGGRSDRQFQNGGNNYLVDVVAPLINEQNYEDVYVMDAHSDVTEACIKNLIKISNYPVVEFALNFLKIIKGNDFKYILVAPDAGASKKINHIAELVGYKNEIIFASKVRDVNGKLSKTRVPLDLYMNTEPIPFIIIDDICDGGRTFVNLSDAIKSQIPNAEIYLIVTHGIFSAGYKILSETFANIFTTNSVKNNGDCYHDGINKHSHNISQLNVFSEAFIRKLGILTL